MSNVTLPIGGRDFTVACAAGEEEHVASLGRMIDQKVSTLGDNATHSEARMLLFGALLLADELHEIRHRNDAGVASASSATDLLAGIADTLEKLAARLEDRAGSA